MAIVKMKRLRLIALRAEQKELLGRLLSCRLREGHRDRQRLADPDWAALLKRDSANLGEVKAQTNGVFRGAGRAEKIRAGQIRAVYQAQRHF